MSCREKCVLCNRLLPDEHHLTLDTYERDNLVALLKLVYEGKLGPVNTGDWVGQLYWRLTDGKGYDQATFDPNIRPEMQAEDVRQHWEAKLGNAITHPKKLPPEYK